MQKLWAVSLSFASALAFAASPAFKESAPLLNEQEVRDPAFVARWLRSAAAGVDQKEATWFFSLGVKEKKSGNWSAASKAFGESMRRYPSPQALFEYADSDLKMLGPIRAKDGFPQESVREDMVHALGFYEASLAANTVTSTLTRHEAERVERHVSCLKSQLASSGFESDCQPARYFSTSSVKK